MALMKKGKPHIGMHSQEDSQQAVVICMLCLSLVKPPGHMLLCLVLCNAVQNDWINGERSEKSNEALKCSKWKHEITREKVFREERLVKGMEECSDTPNSLDR